MPVSKGQTMGSLEEIERTLKERATTLWGSERAAELGALVEATARRVWQVSQDPPPADEEPGFYF